MHASSSHISSNHLLTQATNYPLIHPSPNSLAIHLST
jgi:hypothetical protein